MATVQTEREVRSLAEKNNFLFFLTKRYKTELIYSGRKCLYFLLFWFLYMTLLKWFKNSEHPVLPIPS